MRIIFIINGNKRGNYRSIISFILERAEKVEGKKGNTFGGTAGFFFFYSLTFIYIWINQQGKGLNFWFQWFIYFFRIDSQTKQVMIK